MCDILVSIKYFIKTVEAEIKTVYARYRESGQLRTGQEMQAVKWTAEGMVKVIYSYIC